MDQCIHHGPVVGTVACGLDHHIAGKAQVVTQSVELMLGGVTRRVLALGCVGEFGTGTEHMAMCIHCA